MLRNNIAGWKKIHHFEGIYHRKDSDFHGRTVCFREGKALILCGQTEKNQSRSQGHWFAELDSLTKTWNPDSPKIEFLFKKKEFMLNHQ